MQTTLSFDVLIIGSGAAGLTLALNLAAHCKVAVISKNTLHEGSTYYAQGGISAVLDSEDSFDSHIQDTLTAGAGLCDEEIVRFTVENGPKSIAWLENLGVQFTLDKTTAGEKEPHLTREGGHSHRRVIHAADATGKAVETTLVSQVKTHQNITLLEHHIAVDLITQRKLALSGPDRILGAYVLDIKQDTIHTVKADFVALATGGASKVYLYTSNPDGSTGDGIAMGWRAGCRVADMEFMQFHPTCLFHPSAKSSLISEALRGEGGHLLNGAGERFMQDYDERLELAPRDIVARAIDDQMKRRGEDNVYLDISHRPADFIIEHFPNIYKTCLSFGYDITREKIPIVAELAGYFNSEVHILGLQTSSHTDIRYRIKAYVAQAEDYFKERDIKFVSVFIDSEQITDDTLEYAKKIKANLIAIMTEQETTTANLWMGPYASQMVNHSPYPVLSVKPKSAIIL